jgi:hypothetical protein
MAVKYSSFAGWAKNLELSNDSVELIITLEVGPRIISYRSLEGRNVFKLVDEEAGKSNEEDWKLRGGHRLWIAPEDFGKKDSLTYAPDNRDVEHVIEDEFTVRVSCLTEKPTRLRREMVIQLAKTGPKVTVEHRISNESAVALELSPWALSVMAPGGQAILPQPPLGTHPQAYAPNRAIVVWPFTDLSDGRLRIGRRLICVRQAVGLPLKIGLRHTAGWAAYLLDDNLFLTSVPFVQGATYPDLGSNFETFTNAGFLELETLGPLGWVGPDETFVHQVSWALFSNVRVPNIEEEEGFLRAIRPYQKQLLKFGHLTP